MLIVSQNLVLPFSIKALNQIESYNLSRLYYIYHSYEFLDGFKNILHPFLPFVSLLAYVNHVLFPDEADYVSKGREKMFQTVDIKAFLLNFFPVCVNKLPTLRIFSQTKCNMYRILICICNMRHRTRQNVSQSEIGSEV